ncbi:glycosyltransferase family 4 protein [Flavobacteriaceae bacterium GSB9]|nr:glycosyltransferase family 4 protein [Flavobacteriaceae bacterium GSB9]
MKIALVLPTPPSYSETFFRSKIQGLLNHGHKVVLVTGRTTEKFDLCNVIYHPKVYKNKYLQVLAMLKVFMGLCPYYESVFRFLSLEKQAGTPFKRIIEKLYINATLLKLKVDWVHFGFATMAIDRELVPKAIKAKMAVSFRGYDINVYPLKHNNAYSILWQQVDKVHSISNDLLQRAYRLGLPETTPYHIITPAVNLDAHGEPEQAKNHKTIRIVTIARLHYIKGIDLLLEIAAILREKHMDFVWEVIGSGHKKEEERYLYQKYRLGLHDNVRFLGKMNHQETLNILKQADLYVQTSVIEGFCNAVLEAQSLGKLALAFDKGGLRENIKEGETGFLVKAVNATAMANTIIEVIKLPIEDKQNIREQAKQRVKQHFNLEQQQKVFNQFYTV